MKRFKKTFGFTLAEIMVVLVIISIIVMATMKISQSKIAFGNKIFYNAAFANLQKISTELIGQGCMSTDTTLCATVKSLPLKLHTTDADVTKNGGFCDRIADIVNTIGTVDCTATVPIGTTDFSNQTPAFKLSNGVAVYNMGAAQISPDILSSHFIDKNFKKNLVAFFSKLKRDWVYSYAAWATTNFFSTATSYFTADNGATVVTYHDESTAIAAGCLSYSADYFAYCVVTTISSGTVSHDSTYFYDKRGNCAGGWHEAINQVWALKDTLNHNIYGYLT